MACYMSKKILFHYRDCDLGRMLGAAFSADITGVDGDCFFDFEGHPLCMTFSPSEDVGDLIFCLPEEMKNLSRKESFESEVCEVNPEYMMGCAYVECLYPEIPTVRPLIPLSNENTEVARILLASKNHEGDMQ